VSVSFEWIALRRILPPQTKQYISMILEFVGKFIRKDGGNEVAIYN